MQKLVTAAADWWLDRFKTPDYGDSTLGNLLRKKIADSSPLVTPEMEEKFTAGIAAIIERIGYPIQLSTTTVPDTALSQLLVDAGISPLRIPYNCLMIITDGVVDVQACQVGIAQDADSSNEPYRVYQAAEPLRGETLGFAVIDDIAFFSDLDDAAFIGKLDEAVEGKS